uniref:DnaJ homolog subfamily C member 22 n=1 Tax=Timema cristinae TaxID=61476 RepID=A0A7R9CIL0_TIMCR|nr:unnamed protein product [Timema cristinae]
MAKKSMLTTYILWFIGGVFGLHHLYLGRDAQAFLWWCTLGGYVGCGWLRDIFYIPEYVSDANEDVKFIRKHVARVRQHDKPPFSSVRFFGMFVVAYLWSSVVTMAIPEEHIGGINWRFLIVLAPLACALEDNIGLIYFLGVWTVGNIGREQGTIWWPLVAAYATFPLYYYFEDDTTAYSLMTFVSSLAFDTWSKKWRRTPPKKKSLAKRITTLTVCGVLYLSLWGSYFYFNTKLTDSEGEEIPVREAIHHFFTSPWWVDLKQSLHDTYVYAQHHGWVETWRQIIDLSDPHGEQNAYKVLGVSGAASQSEIRLKYRELSREFHPDKVKDPEKRREAQEQFMEIQQAYETLSKIKGRRSRKNQKFERE